LHFSYKPYYIKIIFFATFFFCGSAKAQSFYIKKYTVDDGLPASYIIRVYQDSRGFLWISTVNGLSRFDGKEFVNYGYENGMPHIIADAIYEDREHRLWIGTRNGMAQVKRKSCVVYPVDGGQKINFVFQFYQLRNGDLWALTGNGIYQFENDHWKKVKLYKDLENSSCRTIIETDSGIIFNYPYQIILKRNNGSFQILQEIKNHKNPDPFFNNIFNQDDRLYINMVYGLYEVKGKDTMSLYKEELKDKYILFNYKDKAGRFWIYTLNDQLMISAPGDKQHFIYKKPLRLVSCFFEDRDGNMWVACIDGLLKIRVVDYENNEKIFRPGLTGNCSVISIPDNTLLISGAGNNLFRISVSNTNNNFEKAFSIKQSGLHKEMIDGWCADEQGKVWLIFREQEDLFVMQNNEVKLLSGLVRDNIHPLTGVAYSARNHKVYVCADLLQSGNEKEMNFFSSSNGRRQVHYPVCIHYFSNGLLLVGTLNDGFFLIDDKENIYPISKEVMPFYDAAGSTFFFDDPSGKFWIGSSYGLVRYQWNKRMMPEKDLEITTGQGLPNSGVRTMAFDNMNRIWAVTLSGIVVIEIDSSTNNAIRVNRVSEEQGISSQYWEESSLAADKYGNIWVGLTNQLLKFDPRKVQFEKGKPSVIINDIQLNSENTDWSRWTDSTEEITQLPYQPVLPHNKNNIGISYKGISFSYASSLEYSYKLEDADSNWSGVTHSDFVSFVRLPPGKYIFKVRGRKSNSEWSEPAEFGFSIRKPYWQTVWFRLVIIFLIAAAVYLIYRYRLNEVKNIMNMRLKISRDLHDEVGSTLSGIGIISEVAKQELENKKAHEVRESLDKISSNTEEILGKMSDIIWAINPQNESVINMVNRLKVYARSVTSAVGIQLYFDSEKLVEKKDLTMQQLSSIYLICKEAINNAVKYSSCQNLRVKMQNEDHRFLVSIRDDGKGFDPRKVFDGNGLKNIQARAQEIKADLKIDSDHDIGTEISVSVKIT